MPSKNPKVREIEKEASRRAAADGKSSHKERFEIRKALRADAGLGKEQKTRGGIAGAYDRNKDYVLPIAAGLAGLTGFGGAFAPAILGGLKGFDREGQGGIGFDVGQGLSGAAMGGAAGALGGLAGNALNVGVGALPAAVPAGATAGAAGAASTAVPGVAGASGALPAAVPATGGMANAMGGLGGILGKVNSAINSPLGQTLTSLGTAAYGIGQQKKANDLTTGAIAADRERWQAGAPLRQAGSAALLNPQRTDTSALQTLSRRGNPFALPNAIPAGGR